MNYKLNNNSGYSPGQLEDTITTRTETPYGNPPTFSNNIIPSKFIKPSEEIFLDYTNDTKKTYNYTIKIDKIDAIRKKSDNNIEILVNGKLVTWTFSSIDTRDKNYNKLLKIIQQG
jgi:hypothetical protein